MRHLASRFLANSSGMGSRSVLFSLTLSSGPSIQAKWDNRWWRSSNRLTRLLLQIWIYTENWRCAVGRLKTDQVNPSANYPVPPPWSCSSWERVPSPVMSIHRTSLTTMVHNWRRDYILEHCSSLLIVYPQGVTGQRLGQDTENRNLGLLALGSQR